MTLARRGVLAWLFVCAVAALAWAGDSPFREPALLVRPSPGTRSQLPIPAGEKVVDFDVWSFGPEAAILVRAANGAHRVLLWEIGTAEARDAQFDIPQDFQPRSLACHPAKRTIYLSGKRGAQYIIAAFEFNAGKWQGSTIYSSQRELRRLLVSPRPFAVAYDQNAQRSISSHRIIFGARAPNGAWGVRTITEDGKRDYEIIGPEKNSGMLDKDDDAPPNTNPVPFALPSAFHPAGHILLWEDAQRCFSKLPYEDDNWGKPGAISPRGLCGGSVTVTPNGTSLIHWLPNQPGVRIYSLSKPPLTAAGDVTFLSTPSSVPDGKGLVGLVQSGTATALSYVPIDLPLSDVFNAWMFAESPADRDLFSQNHGLLRDLNQDQLYELYDSELYQCQGYNSSVPTRPYFVTTDIFWEVFSAAYEGTFIVQERQRAMPVFWFMVASLNNHANVLPAGSPWIKVFKTLTALRTATPATADPELQRIFRAEDPAMAPFGKEMNYADLKPRGHYAAEPELSRYFRAFKYLTIASGLLKTSELSAMPAETRDLALKWIGAYDAYIAPSRSPLVWRPDSKAPDYARHPGEEPAIFPLSWGFDNEVLLSTVYHRLWPAAEQITGPNGPRLLASGMDVPAALGSSFARSLLQPEIAKYPPLAAALDSLSKRFNQSRTTIYDDWISSLAIQWADHAVFPGESETPKLWTAKRLQTGLASWSTLRHATVLVNERTEAECGEGGFEWIELAPPRGYVEPDPETFSAIAGLFDHLAKVVASSPASWSGALAEDQKQNGKADQSLREGVSRRLNDSAQKARLFAAMAGKELRNEALTDQDYQEILYVGRAAEHNFLVFNSLAKKDFGLSNPDPMPKTADVAAGPEMFLQAAVGRPMEWDQVVPFFGRKEIVKGAVYSYYEFASPRPITDADWLKQLRAHKHPQWIQPFVSGSNLSCPAKSPF